MPASIGPEDGKFTYHNETNRNGKYLVDLAMEKNLIITRGKLWTYTSPEGNQYQLDYILVWRKWRNSVKNAEAYSTFGSDHRIVSARIKLSLRKSEKIPRKKFWSYITSMKKDTMGYQP